MDSEGESKPDSSMSKAQENVKPVEEQKNAA